MRATGGNLTGAELMNTTKNFAGEAQCIRLPTCTDLKHHVSDVPVPVVVASREVVQAIPGRLPHRLRHHRSVRDGHANALHRFPRHAIKLQDAVSGHMIRARVCRREHERRRVPKKPQRLTQPWST